DERANLVAAVTHAAEHGPRPVAWFLADTLRGYFHLRVHPADWSTTAHAALTAARHDDDVHGQAAAHLSLGDLHWRQSRHETAIHHYAQASALAERACWPAGQAANLANLGALRIEVG